MIAFVGFLVFAFVLNKVHNAEQQAKLDDDVDNNDYTDIEYPR